MHLRARFHGLWLACAILGVAGCTLTPKPQPVGPPPPTPEQRAWWEANRSRAHYVHGNGYYVEGTSGFFDDQGRPLPPGSGPGSLAEAEGEDGGFLKAISPSNNWKKFKAAIGKGPNEQIARAAFDQGEILFRQGNYTDARPKYELAYDRWPDSPLEEEALFKAAECLFFCNYYSAADDTYGTLLKKYTSTTHLDQVIERRFSIARYWEQCDTVHHHMTLTPNFTDRTRPKFDTYGHALRVYDRVRLDDPTGPWADVSIMATANSHFTHGHWTDADYYYGLLRTEYPKSRYQYYAHLLGLQAKLKKYQGPDYEGKPLDEAEELISQLLTQFPHELGNEREKVILVKADIRRQKAMREWNIAQFYENGKYYGAAKIYYASIAKTYADTPVAKEALAKIDQIKDLPPVPASKLKWLEELFPESKKNGPTIASLPSGPSGNATR